MEKKGNKSKLKNKTVFKNIIKLENFQDFFIWPERAVIFYIYNNFSKNMKMLQKFKIIEDSKFDEELRKSLKWAKKANNLKNEFYFVDEDKKIKDFEMPPNLKLDEWYFK